MNRRVFFTLPLLLLSLLPHTLHAQARLAIYGAVGGEQSGLRNQPWTLAENAGFYVGLNQRGPLRLSIDARADLSSNANSGLLGPRLALRFPALPVKPYAEILIGFVDFSRTTAGLKAPNQFSPRAVFGADTSILPHLDWRIADFSYALNNSSNGDQAKTLSTGLVFRL